MFLNKCSVFIIFILLLDQANNDVINTYEYLNSEIILPQKLRPYMFKNQINGKINVMIPSKQNCDHKDQKVREEYEIQMVKTKQQFLPAELYHATTIYAYGGQTTAGYKASFPGPAIFATKDRPIKVTWKNNIPGKHILPVDYNYPFENSSAFRNQVPTVVHAHGVAVNTASDGEPEAYWTKNGIHSQSYSTAQPCAANSAVFIYPNEQQAGNNWYHDHAIGITRLNVYAGLAGFYKILDPQSKQEPKITAKYGSSVSEDQTKYLIVTDKTFQTNGQLYYPAESMNPQFSSWVPQFYGNTMLVNGVIWPLMNLTAGKHRFVLLNACQSRYLNLYFDNSGKKIPFELIRIDGDYFDSPVTVTQYLFTISSRVEFIIDLTKIQGQVILKNNASAPYPFGDSTNLNLQFTGQVMKFLVKASQCQLKAKQTLKIEIDNLCHKKNAPYPYFSQGQKVFTTLFQAKNSNGDVSSAFIDGISMMNGGNCSTSTYKIGKTYDFYFINLTPDSHPIHFHLINMQKVKQYTFNVSKYSDKYFEINGGRPGKMGFEKAPINLDPDFARLGQDELPQDYEKVFRDTIDANPGYVTVFRIKFAKNNGSSFKTFDLKKQRYVYHCHILEHQDNQMMKYFCLQ